jgi:sugar O-acyltransferase (sialic acid O-acetyltransferase NeuD family)
MFHMKNLIIVGAGSTARERLDAVKKINLVENRWDIKGFISDNLNDLDNIECDYQIIDTIMNYVPQKNDVFVCGIAMPAAKEKVVSILKEKGARFETIIHPATVLGDFVTIGEGCYINGFISPNARIGNFVSVMGSMVGGGAVIGDYSTTTGFANVTNAKLGKGVFIGSHAVLLNNLVIGDGSFVGAGSVVVKNVKEGTRVFGNPAKVLRI